MESEKDYPYEGKDKTCRYKASKGQVKVSKWNWAGTNTSAMMSATNKSAMSVAIYASARSFSTYKSGVYTNATCSTEINHGVAVVGYKSNDYWIVRNSWGTGWGESGYIRMAMTDGKGTCGIN
jgi:cathepsin L